MEMNYTVLENGLDFILMAINNLSIINESATDDETKKRLIKYSLLHLSSGIELVLKHILFQEHWTYVFADMNKAKEKALQSGDFKSVDSETVIERLKGLCGIELNPKEIKDLRNLRKSRNKVEHFNLNENLLSIENLIHKNISITIKLIVMHYNLNKFTDEENELFLKIKDLLRKSQQHYNDAKIIAQRELEQSVVKSHITTCPECEEEFLLRDGDTRCIFCGYEATGEDAARDYISNILGISEYETGKYGEEWPQYRCPECDSEALVFNWETKKAICFSCDYENDVSNFSFCSRCGMPFIGGKDELGICPECIVYIFNKDD